MNFDEVLNRRFTRFMERAAALDINESQVDDMRKVYQLIIHGSKFINLHIRKDGREYHLEADWLRQLFQSLAKSDGHDK